MEDVGAAAIVMYSLFEEQITFDSQELDHYLSYGTDSFAEATQYFPDMETFHVGPDAYLNKIHQAKDAVDIPIIGSFTVLGYAVQVIRNVRDEQPDPLPEWDEFAQFFIEGLKVGLGILLYFTPIFLLSCGLFAVILGVEATIGSNSADAESIIAVTATCLLPILGIRS